MPRYALDTSVAVPLLVDTHDDHDLVFRWAAGNVLVLAGHALAETYSVLTRLAGDIRLAAPDAVAVIERSFPHRPRYDDASWADLPRRLSAAGIDGGAVYDALVGLAAASLELPLATRDARAASTYERLGVEVEIVS